ncbi:MAG TPA: hypothetical protein VGI16_11375 [Candidatus Acidoferrum sp.]|jgi:hypothetical protein
MEDSKPKTPPLRTVMALAVAIRSHLRNGKNRGEILEIEQVTKAQYRYAIRVLGKFPERNEDAFANFFVGVQGRLEDVEKDIAAARTVADFRALGNLHRTAHLLHLSIFEMAMKLGILRKAADDVNVNVCEFKVGFGDENLSPKWPGQTR